MAEPARLRIAYVGDPNSVHVRRWAGFFADRGHDVHLLVPDDVPMPAEGPLPAHRFRALPSPITPAGVLRTRADLRRIVGELRPDVVHAHFARRLAWYAWLSGARPYFVTVWGSDVLATGRMTRFGRLATRLALRGASVVTAASDALADGAVRMGADPGSVRRVQFGVDLERYTATPPAGEDLRSEIGLGTGRIVLSPRAMTPLYRHDVVVRAFAGLPPDTTLVMLAMNEDQAYRRRIEALVGELGIGARVRILPEAGEEMAALYRAAEVVVSVPESDGVPVTVLEAMATQRPVVAGDLPGVRDWLGEAQSELLVPIGDVESTRAALERALEMAPDARTTLGHRLRAAIEERASRQRNMEMVEAWYREAARGVTA